MAKLTHQEVERKNKAKAEKLAANVARQVLRGAGKGLNAARVFLTGRMKEALSVPAPRKTFIHPVTKKRVGYQVIVGPGGEEGRRYVAATPATVGAPPRKLSGRLRTSVTSAMTSSFTAVIGANARGEPSKKHPGGFNYPLYHEVKNPKQKSSGGHPFILPTALKYKSELAIILAKNARFSLLQLPKTKGK